MSSGFVDVTHRMSNQVVRRNFTSETSELFLQSDPARAKTSVQVDAGGGDLVLCAASQSEVSVTASATNHTIVIPAGSYFELPDHGGNWFGYLDAAGGARITEFFR